MKKDVVAGLGEIGSAILKLLSKKQTTIGYDLDKRLVNETKLKKLQDSQTSFLHIAIPVTSKFDSNLLQLYKKFKPECIVIHSTIGPGTTERIQKKLDVPLIYSATRGVHKRMLKDIKRYTKFFAISKNAPKKQWAIKTYSRKMKNFGVKTKQMSKPETLELAKIICDTSYYGWLINYGTPEVHHYLFFETAASIITLVLLGNYFEKRSIHQTTSALDALKNLQTKDALKEVDGKTQFIKDPKSDVSPVETILKALDKRREYKKEELEYEQQKQIALYHTLQTVKLDSLTKLAFIGDKNQLREDLNVFLQTEYQASTKLPYQVMLTQWIMSERDSKPINISFEFTPVSKEKIVETLERSLEIRFDAKTTNDLHQIINSYSSEKQQQLINTSIWRDLETVSLIRQSYLKEYLKSEDKSAFRFQLIEDLAYELTSTEFNFTSN